MKLGTCIACVTLLVACAWPAAGGAAIASDDAVTESPAADPAATSWPLRFTVGEVVYTMYYPQFDDWQDDRLRARAAVGAQASATNKPDYGEISITARTVVDAGTRRVFIRDIAVTRVRFPTAPTREQPFLTAFRQQLPGDGWNVPLERLQADIDIDNAQRSFRARPVRNDPPRIVYRDQPALLVPVDGEPALREVEGTGFSRVINTRALLLQDGGSRRFYVSVAKTWFEAPGLDGPWIRAADPPNALGQIREDAEKTGSVDLLDQSGSVDGLPEVVVSTVPTELIQTNGPPRYQDIPNTRLSYVTNSPNQIFLDARNRRHYVLLAGRWYQSDSLRDGPWHWLTGASLPADFAAIPPDSPVAGVRASVPGTPQAEEAVIASRVPQVATVKRSAATLVIGYDGEPRFEPIASTRLQSAVNAPMPVIRVDANDFYALDNGVWFSASAPEGPWAVATYVPPIIYTIPPSSPLHYVTYVRLYGSGEDVVSTGYTSGYVGSYVYGNTVVYGTGWHYRPWLGTVWYSPPITWGFGFGYWQSWWNPWVPFYPRPYWGFRPWWGPWGSTVIVTRVTTAPPVPRQFVIHAGGVDRTSVTNIYNRWGSAAAPHPGFDAGSPAHLVGHAAPISAAHGEDLPLHSRMGESGASVPRSRWITVPPSNPQGTPLGPSAASGRIAGAAPPREPFTPRESPGGSMAFDHSGQTRLPGGDRFEHRSFGSVDARAFAPSRNPGTASAPIHGNAGHGFHGGGGRRR